MRAAAGSCLGLESRQVHPVSGWFFSLIQHVLALVGDLFISPALLGCCGFSAGAHPVDTG